MYIVTKCKQKIKLQCNSKTKDDVISPGRPCFSRNFFGCIHPKQNRQLQLFN